MSFKVMQPVRVNKPWGYEEIWAKTDYYAGKILHIEPGQELSLQYHKTKRETIRVLEGVLMLTYFDEGEPPTTRELAIGDAFMIWPGLRHRMHAASKIYPTKVLEVSTPELDDVVRIEDKYGRVG
jgi:mannose-6-phosphate isomerase